MTSSRFLPFIWVAVATIFISLSGPLGRYINLEPPFVIFIRSLLGVLFLGSYSLLSGQPLRWPLRDKTLLLTGVIMCAHWVLFFYSLKYASVAIAAVSVFTYPMQTILLESLIKRKPVHIIYLVLSALVALGVILLNPDFSLDSHDSLGILFGLLSGTLLALRNIYSKILLSRQDANSVYFVQVFITTVLLIPFAWQETWTAVTDNVIPLLLLGLLTTTVGHLLMMKSMRFFTAGEVGLLISGQPVSAIIIAYFLLNEKPDNQVLYGALLILLAVFISFQQIRKEKRS